MAAGAVDRLVSMEPSIITKSAMIDYYEFSIWRSESLKRDACACIIHIRCLGAERCCLPDRRFCGLWLSRVPMEEDTLRAQACKQALYTSAVYFLATHVLFLFLVLMLD